MEHIKLDIYLRPIHFLPGINLNNKLHSYT